MKPQEFNEALPSDEEIAARAMCQRLGSCPCDRRMPCLAMTVHGDDARAVIQALSRASECW